MSQPQLIRCPVCLEPFDSNKRIPKISPTCGHTLCKECLTQVLKMMNPKCPLDKLKFDKDLQTVDAFPTNFLGQELLEMKGRWSQCELHQKGKKMICLTDKTLVCGKCLIFGDHKGHEARLLSDFADIVKQKMDQLSSISEKAAKIPRELTQNFEGQKLNIKNVIIERFQRLRLKIAKQELDMLFKFENVFMDKKINLENATSKSINLPLDVEAKLKEFSVIMSNPDIVKLTEEDFLGLEQKLDQTMITLRTKQTDEISRLADVFQKSLPNKDCLKYFNILDPLNEKLSKVHKKESSSAQKIQDSVEPEGVVIPLAKLNLICEGKILKVQDSATKNSFVVQKSDIKEVTHIQCKLRLKDETLDSSILSALLAISRALFSVESISLEIDNFGYNINHEIAFYGVILAIFSQPEKLKNITIYVLNVILKDTGSIYLFEQILPKVNDLQSFDCTFSKTRISNAVLRAITKVNFSRFPNLEKFRLDLSGALLKEQDLIQFFKKAPNVKDLSLGFSQTALTDKALESFSNRPLSSLDKVQRLEVILSGTKLTDSGVSKFLLNLPNVTNLIVKLNSLPILNDSVQPFIEKKLPSLTNLKELKCDLDGTKVSQCVKEKLQNPKLRS